MEDWDIPDPQDDFENQFADELEMLDEMGEGINDRKCFNAISLLVFNCCFVVNHCYFIVIFVTSL